jgi:hypothetical protein
MNDPMEFIKNLRTGFDGVDISSNSEEQHESSAYGEIVDSITQRLRNDSTVTLDKLIEHPEIQAVLFSALYEYLADAEEFICNAFNDAEQTSMNKLSHDNFHAATERMIKIFRFIVSSTNCDQKLLNVLLKALSEDSIRNRR